MSTAPSGYSGTPLPQKLGFKPGMRAAFLGAPVGFAATLGELPDGVEVATRLGGHRDLVVVFATARRELVRRVAALKLTIRKELR
ncbi:MAG: hypothetical protein JWQ20_1619 [Conexibacter sp.]|nr:hypothetical protein [Conexibacter sp.]